MIDLRSDTVTRPSAGMLQAMMQAPLGDDVFGEDPSVNALESKAAQLFNMEAALFCPSGTMTNQIAIKIHTQPGDEVICDKMSHVYIYEGGGIAFNSGSQVKPVQGQRGLINAALIEAAINPDDVHKARTSLVVLENTANRGGGACYDLIEIEKIKDLCQQNNLALHLDGARLFNAAIAKGQNMPDFGNLFHSISICLSKGLGAPVGSLLLGTKHFIQQSRRIRKVFGGGMRQAGLLAAAGIYALDNHIQRLAEDHQHATQIADVLATKDFVIYILPVETNIIIFEVSGRFTPQSFAAFLKDKGILAIAISKTQVRMVLHLDITSAMVEQITGVIKSI